MSSLGRGQRMEGCQSVAQTLGYLATSSRLRGHDPGKEIEGEVLRRIDVQGMYVTGIAVEIVVIVVVVVVVVVVVCVCVCVWRGYACL